MKIDFDFACQDNCLDHMVPSDLRQLVSERDRALERVRELENTLRSATPVPRQTSDTLSEMGVFVPLSVSYYRLETDLLEQALESGRKPDED